MRTRTRKTMRSVHDALDAFLLDPNSSTRRTLVEEIAATIGDTSLLAEASSQDVGLWHCGVAHFRQNGQRDQLLKLPEVEAMVGLKKSAIYQMIENKRFPAQTKIGRAARWRVSEVVRWIDAQQEAK